MRKNYFPLGADDDSRLIKITRLLFGVACIALSAWWIYFSISSDMANWSVWLAILFLAGFGCYQLFAGMGHTTRFIIIDRDNILLKKNSILPVITMLPASIVKIDIFPMSIIFIRTSGKKIILRLGSVNYETNEKIVDEIATFAHEYHIPCEVRE